MTSVLTITFVFVLQEGSGTTLDVEIDLDEVLDMDGDAERRKYLQSLLTDAKKSQDVVDVSSTSMLNSILPLRSLNLQTPNAQSEGGVKLQLMTQRLMANGLTSAEQSTNEGRCGTLPSGLEWTEIPKRLKCVLFSCC